MLCERCKKRPAMIYMQVTENGETKSKGYCLTCAKELGIKPVDDMLKQMGISDKDLQAMEEQMESFMEANDGNADMFNIANMLKGLTGGSDEDDEYDGEFEAGGSSTMPYTRGDDKQRGEVDPKDKLDPRNHKQGPKRKFLDQYCENLTEKAKNGKLDNIIGRDKEIYRTIQILSRRQKNNPCLIGEAGVGKTAVVEGLAQAIARNRVPQVLRDKIIYSLDIASLMAGTK
ncbi:MAG: ATP-dependent Clp protease ATP-binding subunit, partial [Oscillospiraceae bacterium]|nr:ATP-dependent Clp protease ATP-binding subunit [Oscillospiraceae bacterium]